MTTPQPKVKYCKLCRKALPDEFGWLAQPFYAKYRIICPICTEQLNAIDSIKPRTRPRRCAGCGKPVRAMNRSLVCSNCQNRLNEFQLNNKRRYTK